MAAPDAKITKLDGANVIDQDVTEYINNIDKVQGKIDELNELASEEILKVEQKYNQLRAPMFEERANWISKIDEFWKTAFLNHPVFSDFIGKDAAALQSLTKLEVQEFDDVKSGYKISFHFKDNSYFTNKVLVKEIHISESGDSTVTSTKIDWKPGQKLTVTDNVNSKGGRKRPMEEPDSFFSWLEDNSEGAADELGEVIKDDIWPNPLQYFIAPHQDNEANDGYEEEVLDDIDEDEEDEEDDEEEEESIEEDEEEEEITSTA